jgi:Tfp pilus assembly protein PilO
MPSKFLPALRPSTALIHAAGGSVMLAAALLFYFAFYAPAAADAHERTARMDQVRLLMGTSEKVAREYHELHDRVTALRDSAAAARQRMPRRTNTQEFIESITQLAVDNGMKVELSSAAAPQTFPTHTQVEIACTLRGGYAGLCRLLADVDHLAQISKVSRLEVASHTNSEQYPVQLTFQLYYRGELHDTEVKREAL